MSSKSQIDEETQLPGRTADRQQNAFSYTEENAHLLSPRFLA
jgi:hypothetical protein